ncbi:MAG: hypothetical protein IKP00_08940 [Victivallales bacterium]|nr:hypothetical protein [Victivallales bacterium]
MKKTKSFSGVLRASMHTLSFANSPSVWQNGLPLGNGQFGGLFYEPDDTAFEYAFTRLDLWKRHLVGPDRLPLDKVLAILQKEGPEALRKELDKEFFDTERPNFKPGGRLSLEVDNWVALTQTHTLFDRRMSLDLARGEVHGSYELASKAETWTALIDPESDVTAIHVEDSFVHELCKFNYRQRLELYRMPDPESEILRSGTTEDGILFIEFGFKEELRALAAVCIDGRPFKVAKGLENGRVAIDIDKNYQSNPLEALKSSLTGDGIKKNTGTRFEYCIYHTLIVDIDGSKGDLLEVAKKRLCGAKAEGFASIQKRNRAWWRNFWNRSGITMENAAMEGLWYNNVYQLAAISRGKVMPGLFGLWNADASAPWSGDYHGDINNSMWSWPLFPLNHPELHECLFSTLESWFGTLRRQTKKVFGVDELRFPQACGPTGEEMSRGFYRMMRCSTGFYADNYIKWALYEPDMKRLRNTILPILESCARYYFLYCKDNGKGTITVGPSWAPEQGVFPAWDTGNDLALFKELFVAVVDFNKRLGQWSDTAAKAEAILAHFPEYPQKDGEFIISGSEEGRTMLCHPSYLACLVPAEEVDADSPLAKVARKTVREHLDHTMRKGLAGKIGVGCDLSAGWLLTSAIKLRDAEYAETLLRDLLISDFVKSNGMFAYIGGRVLHTLAEKRHAYKVQGTQGHSLLGQSANRHGRDKTMSMVQQGGAYLYAVMECMLQSQKNEIKIFPVPLKCFGDHLSFHNLAAEGGLTVSAAKDKKGVKWLEITCGNEPWSGKVRLFGGNLPQSLAHYRHVEGRKSSVSCEEPLVDGQVTVSLKPGEKLAWRRKGVESSSVDAPEHTPGVRSYGKNCPIGYGDDVSYSER